MNELCFRYEWVVFQTWMSCVSDMNELCFRYEWVVFQIWMSCVSDMNESCHISTNHVSCECSSAASANMLQYFSPMSRWVVFQIWMSPITYERIIWVVNAAQQHQRVSHTRIARSLNESCFYIPTSHVTHEQDMSNVNVQQQHQCICNNRVAYFWMSHVSEMKELCFTYQWVMAHMNKTCQTSLRLSSISVYVACMPQSCNLLWAGFA